MAKDCLRARRGMPSAPAQFRASFGRSEQRSPTPDSPDSLAQSFQRPAAFEYQTCGVPMFEIEWSAQEGSNKSTRGYKCSLSLFSVLFYSPSLHFELIF